MARLNQELKEHFRSYEIINQRTIKTYNDENKMWVTMEFNDQTNNEIYHFKEILRQNFIDSFS